jgi:hypothetical protein
MIFGSAKIVTVYHSKRDGMKQDFAVCDICAKVSESTQSTMKLTNHGVDTAKVGLRIGYAFLHATSKTNGS